MRIGSSLLACLALGFTSASAMAANVPVCVLDESVQERFLPVELLTGNPMNDSGVLVLAPVDRTYPYVDELPDGTLGGGEVQLSGPVDWVGEGGTAYQVYERKVPRANERYALTPDKTAMGRVYDERSGNIVNEGKFPVGSWKQGQKRSYGTTYYSQRGQRYQQTTLTVEKLSCTYEGIAGAMQYGYTSGRASYGYIYAPGKGLVQVMTRVRGG